MAYSETRTIAGSGLLKKLDTPLIQLDMELTERCNNNCVHCYINLHEKDKVARQTELSLEKIKDILGQAADLGCLMVRFTGGEPLLREDFPDIYLHARQLGLKVILFTNATLIDDDLIDLFSHIPPLKEVEVSVYGMTKSSYDAISRARGSFERAFAGMEKLLNATIPFVVKGIFPLGHENDLSAFEQFARKIPWMTGAPDMVMHYDLRARRESGKNRQIRMYRIPPESWIDHLKQVGGKSPANDAGRLLVASEDRQKLFTCEAGKTPCVDAYGCVQACLLLRHPETVYDLNTGSLKDALGCFFPAMLEKKAENPNFMARCGRCILRGLCDQCPAKSWMEHGTLDTPVDYYCRLAHIEAEYAGMIPRGAKGWKLRCEKDTEE